MGDQVKRVKENLGVTRLALQIYEERRLIPRVLGRKNREYSDEDINVIWTIRMLRNIGYSLKEVDLMIKSPPI